LSPPTDLPYLEAWFSPVSVPVFFIFSRISGYISLPFIFSRREALGIFSSVFLLICCLLTKRVFFGRKPCVYKFLKAFKQPSKASNIRSACIFPLRRLIVATGVLFSMLRGSFFQKERMGVPGSGDTGGFRACSWPAGRVLGSQRRVSGLPGALLFTRMLEYQNARMLEYWNTGMLECWNARMLECWNAGMLSSDNL